MVRRFLLGTLVVVPLVFLFAGSAEAAPPVFSTDFKFHAFDEMILSSLSYDDASIVYYREFASINADQIEKKKRYEAIGCHPFQVVKNGKVDESGYDCRSFFCVGFERGPKQCRYADGKPYGGVVEINRRFGLTYIEQKPKDFDAFAVADRSAAMNDKIASMAAIKCKPFYLMDFDVAVGEGYTCEELGQFPYFSGENSCADDWRNSEGPKCNFPERAGELEFRRQIMETLYGAVFSSASSVQSQAGSGTVIPEKSFPDVVFGRYGYTAIIDLATIGVVKGYDDGTFRPMNPVNRAEFMKLLIAGVYTEVPDLPSRCFPDVGEEWFSPFVCTGKRLGWLQGYPDGRFRPERFITKAEALKVVVAALDLPLESTVPLPPGVPASAWYSPYVRKAVELGILLEGTFSGSENATRADVAVWIYRARKVQAQ